MLRLQHILVPAKTPIIMSQYSTAHLASIGTGKKIQPQENMLVLASRNQSLAVLSPTWAYTVLSQQLNPFLPCQELRLYCTCWFYYYMKNTTFTIHLKHKTRNLECPKVKLNWYCMTQKKNVLITPGRSKAVMTRKTKYPKTLPMNLKYDLFAVHGDIPARFYHSFAFFVLQAYMISVLRKLQ